LDGWSNFLQAWIHDFFWSSIYLGGGGQPDGEVLELIERDFGSFEEFAKEFKAACVSQFGSGWVWLIFKCTAIFVVDSNACCQCSP
jgi:Fe-Mn family superoxide dismutase